MDVIYDGACGFCRRAVSWLQRLDRHDRIRVHAFQDDGVLDRFGLTRAEAEASVWALAPGDRACGARAVCAALDRARGTGFFSRLHALPGMGVVLEWAYRWVADHRGRLPGLPD